MIYMTAFWIIITSALVIYYTTKKENPALFLTMVASSFLIVGIITRDPLFYRFGIPAEFEWVVGLCLAAFTSWRLYFNPLKGRVIKNEKKIVSLKTDITSIKSDTAISKSDVSTLKSDVSTLKSDVAVLKSDTHSIKSDVKLIKDRLI